MGASPMIGAPLIAGAPSPASTRSARAIGSGLAGGLAAADADGSVLEPANDLHVERGRCRAERLDELVAVGDRPACHLDDEVALLDGGASGVAAVLDATDEQPVTLREPHRPPQPASHL